VCSGVARIPSPLTRAQASVNPPSPASLQAVPPPTSTEEPFFFESHERPLYAVYHDARRRRPGAPVAVVVSSLGVEPLVNYRNRVLSARGLAEIGIPVLRYHPRGHGDSAGDWAEVTHSSLIEDARVAARLARERSGSERVLWLTSRFGSLIAAGAMGDGPDAGLGMWEPVHRPLDYFRNWLRGMLFSKVARGETPKFSPDELLERVRTEGHVDVHGYYLHRTLLESTEGAELTRSLARWAGPTLLVQIQGRRALTRENEELTSALAARGAEVTTEIVNEEVGWQFLQNPLWESPQLIRATTEWADAVA